MKTLQASRRPRELLESMTSPGQPPHRRMYLAGFESYFERMPVIDATNKNQTKEVALTRQVLDELCEVIQSRLFSLDIPTMAEGEFGRLILGIEEPKERGGIVIPGTEVVLALWGKGFASPVHGHAAGYIHEALVAGGFDVFIYKPVGLPADRIALLNHVIAQRSPGTFYSEFVQDAGQERRSALVHNFVAVEQSMSVHYLPEHIRDGNANRYTPVGSLVSGAFQVQSRDVQRVTSEVAMQSKIGDVYLVRSPSVAEHGDHYILIIGGLVQKSHGLRPNDIEFQAPPDSPLRDYDPRELVLLKLSASATDAFYEHAQIVAQIRIGGLGILPPGERFK